MPSLQVRDLPDPIYFKLKQEAQKGHRSLAQQAVITLAKGLDVSIKASMRRENALARIAELTEKTKEFDLPDPLLLIREDRER